MLIRRFFSVLCAAVMAITSFAEVSYEVIPLPRSIELSKKGESYTLRQNAFVSFPADNERMATNAELLASYLKQDAGFAVTPLAGAKKTAAISLTLGLKSDNPEAYRITVDKHGVTIQGATEEGVFRGVQTLRKAIGTEAGEQVELPYVTIDDQPRFGYRGVHTSVSCNLAWVAPRH